MDNPAPQTIAEAIGRVEEILKQRNKPHGSFDDNARITCRFQAVIYAEEGWKRLTDVQALALQMILHKVARVLSGDPNFPDHWDDIAGYATLVSNRLHHD